MTYIHKHSLPVDPTRTPESGGTVQQSMMFAEKLERFVSRDRFEFDILEGQVTAIHCL
jgi:hypothetical protein